MMTSSRDKYRNPCTPAGYTSKQKPRLKLKDGLVKIDGVICQFMLPMIKVGLFDTTQDFSKFVINSDSEDDEEEILVVPVADKEPIVIVLDDSDEEIKPSDHEDVESKTSENIAEEQLNHVSTEQVQAPATNRELVIGEKEVENMAVKKAVKNSATEEQLSKTAHVKEVEQVSEKNKSPPVEGEKIIPPEVTKGKASPMKTTSRKKQQEDCSSDSSITSIHSVFPEKNTESSPVQKRKIGPERVKREISPKKRASRKEKHDGYNSDTSAHSSHSKTKSPKKEQKYSHSDSEDSEDRKISRKNEEVVNENLFGRYHCRFCNATMNSLATFETHLSGKRHIKTMKLRNVVETVQKTIQPILVESKYPPPPPGVCRTRVRESSYIQDIIQRSIRQPCPGLDNVIEIRGMTETTYFCELCAAPCSTATIISHLTGYRHLLRCLKHFDPERYESVRDRKKFEVEKKLERWLEDIEIQYGRGRIVVEKEISVKKDPHGSSSPKSERRRREEIPGPSYRDPEDSYPQNYSSTTIPDTSKSDFYCRICDSHMNNPSMWDMHIRGKRHLANVKKAPGELPSKTKTVLLPNARAKIMNEIDRVREPVVGLGDMREVQNPEAAGELYNCFLCGACLTRRDVVEHVLSLKHRKKYLEKINHPDIVTINHMNILDSHMYSVIEETCYGVEAEIGRGQMEVHVMKNALTGVKW